MSLHLDTIYNTDNYVFYNNIMESVLSNNRIRKIANNIYNNLKKYLIDLLSENNLIELSKDINIREYSITPVKNSEVITYKGISTFILPVNIFNQQIDLTIILETRNSKNIDYAYYNDENKSITIFVPNADIEYISLGNIKYILQIPDIIIHELIHFIDDIRSDNKFDITNKADYNYYNDPAEIHAFAQQLLNYIYRNYIQDYEIKELENLLQKNNFDKFVNYILSNIDPYSSMFTNNTALSILKQFYKNLTDENKEKVMKTLAQRIRNNLKDENYKEKLVCILMG